MSQSGADAPPSVRHLLSLWAGALAGPVAWFVQLQGVYALTMKACDGQTRVMLHLAALACVLLAGAGAGLSWHNWRGVRGWPSDWDQGSAARVRFLSVLGMLTGALFLVVMLAQWIAVFLLDPCPV